MKPSGAVYARLHVFAQNWACTAAGWQRARLRYGAHFQRTLAEWEETGLGPLERLYAIQRQRLDQLVERARAHVPHYAKLDLPPPCDLADPCEAIARTLASIPILEKSSYRAAPESFIARDIPPRKLIRGRTSGTTGSALPLWYTSEALAEEYAAVWRLRRAWGASLADPHLTFGGQIVVPFGQCEPPFWRTNRYGRQTLFSLYHMSPENLPHYVEAIHEAPASFAQGYPSSLHLVARKMLDMGRPLPKGRLKAVFTSSESLLAFQRAAIEEAFGAPVRDRYGVSEFAVSMTERKPGRLHLDMEFCIAEVDTREETRDWVRGPLLVTGLANHATPLLRYRIGDVATRLKDPTNGHVPGEVFLDVDGRIEDYVVTPEGRLVGRLDHVFKEQHDVAEAQILQDSREAIEVRIVPRETWGAASERSLRKELRARLGDRIGIEVRIVEAIDREGNGKFRAVKSSIARSAS